MAVQAKWNNRKTVIASFPEELERRVKDHKKRGWVTVGNVSISHGVYRSEYIQVMKFCK